MKTYHAVLVLTWDIVERATGAAHAGHLELKMWEILNVAANDPAVHQTVRVLKAEHSTEMMPSGLLRMHIFEMSEITEAS